MIARRQVADMLLAVLLGALLTVAAAGICLCWGLSWITRAGIELVAGWRR